MANDRWRDEERQRWDSDRDRYSREGSGYSREGSSRQDLGRREAQRRDWSGGDSPRRELGRQDYGRDDYWRRTYGRDSDRGDYNRYRSENEGRRESYGIDDRYSRDYGSGTGYSGYGRGGYGSSNYSEPSRDQTREQNWGSGYSGSAYRPDDDYERERYAWSAGLAEWPAPIADWRAGYREDWRRSQDFRDQRGERSWGGGRESDRGWWDRTKDEVRSWMGDEEAERRRRMDMSRMGMSGEGQRRGHMGRGPKGYTRSDQRILEDVSDRLTDDWSVDASEIEVAVVGCEVTLSGMVDSRETKRRAENIAAEVTGVKDVQNNLRVRQPASQVGTNLTGTSSAALEQTTGLSSTPSTQAGNTRPKH
jgi:hypothetical protein